MIGTRPACRALGASHGDRSTGAADPAAAAAREAAGRAGAGAHRRRAPGGAGRALLAAVRRQLAGAGVGRRCSTRAAISASQRTMYRILAAEHGGVRERRHAAAQHPAYTPRRRLLAQRPNELWSWDITKLLGPAKWTYFYLYVILDVFSRYAVAWTIAHRESAELAKALIAQATEQQQIAPGTLTVTPTRQLDDQQAGRVARRSRRAQEPQQALTSTDNPYQKRTSRRSRSARVPRALRDHRAGAGLRSPLLRLVQPPPSPFRIVALVRASRTGRVIRGDAGQRGRRRIAASDGR